jgi:transcriptional regulator with XRE-family HTH domain
MRDRDLSQTAQSRSRKDIAFSENLKKLMADGKLSLDQICQISGVAKSVAHGWVNGVVPRDLQAVAKLSDALNMQFRELLLGEPELIDKRESPKAVLSEIDLFEQFCQLLIQRIKNKI